MRHGLFIFALVALRLLCPNAEAAGDTIRIAEDTTPVFRNPGKGWVFYDADLRNLTAEEKALGSLCYRRYTWRELEDKEGAIKWDTIEAQIAKAKANGLKYAFGVMNVSSDFGPWDGFAVPQWVFRAGALSYQVKDTRGVINTIPRWTDNPVFFEKLNAFIAALGAHFDVNPDLAFVDIRDFGNWGEGHLGHIDKDVNGRPIAPPGPAQLQTQYFQPYRSAFTKTQLIVPFGDARYDSIYEWCVNHGIGMRRDGLPDWSDGTDIRRAYGKAPAVVEYTDSYQNMIKQGTWDDAKVIQAAINAGAAYAEISRGGPKQFLADKAGFMRALANRLGYHFVLQTVAVPGMRATAGAGFPVSMEWVNKGSNYLLNENCTLVLALLDDKDNIADTCILAGVDPRGWAPGKIRFQTQAKFRSAPDGQYRLALGLFTDPGRTPDYRIGNAGKTASGWYILAQSFSIDHDTAIRPVQRIKGRDRMHSGIGIRNLAGRMVRPPRL